MKFKMDDESDLWIDSYYTRVPLETHRFPVALYSRGAPVAGLVYLYFRGALK
jgi:hypothetical protein